MFRINEADDCFEGFKSLRIELDESDVINFCEFDQNFENIFIVRNQSVLEKRSMADLQSVSMRIELEERIGDSVSKLLDISNDGKWSVLFDGLSLFELLLFKRVHVRKC